MCGSVICYSWTGKIMLLLLLSGQYVGLELFSTIRILDFGQTLWKLIITTLKQKWMQKSEVSYIAG